MIYFKDQDSIQDYKKVIKILDLGIDLFLGPRKYSRLQESDQDLGFGYRFLFRIKITRK